MHRKSAIPKERGINLSISASLKLFVAIVVYAIFREFRLELAVLHFLECVVVHASDVDDRDDIAQDQEDRIAE